MTVPDGQQTPVSLSPVLRLEITGDDARAEMSSSDGFRRIYEPYRGTSALVQALLDARAIGDQRCCFERVTHVTINGKESSL